MKAQRVDTWAVSIADKPGALAAKLKALSAAGVNLEFVIARRAPEKPRTGVIFVTPIKGRETVRRGRCRGIQKGQEPAHGAGRRVRQARTGRETCRRRWPAKG